MNFVPNRPLGRRPRRERVVVIGAGQAGLAASWWLSRHRIEHVVLERARVGASWRERRWDSFRLVTPNWMLCLPGAPDAAPDPHGFLSGAGLAGHLEHYAKTFGAPVEAGVDVKSLRACPEGFRLDTTSGAIEARAVIVACGTFHRPARPEWAARLPRRVHQLGALEYRRPDALPEGAALVVGSGQSGAQIAQELARSGRRVFLATGRTPRLPRRHRGRDTMRWLVDAGQFDETVHTHPLGEGVRRRPNAHVAAGAALDLRRLGHEGVRLLGRAVGASGSRLAFAPDLPENLAAADRGAERFQSLADAWIAESGASATGERETPFAWTPSDAPESLELGAERVRSVIWATGLVPDYSWVRFPVFGASGYPRVRRGLTDVPGLAFLGLHWMHRWSSGLLLGVGRDASYVVSRLFPETRSRTSSRSCFTSHHPGGPR